MQDHHYEDQVERYDELDEADRDLLCNWIGDNIRLRKAPNYDRTSYGLKHIFSDATGCYVCNGEFKGAMIACGYAPMDKRKQNSCYRIRN